MRNYSLKFRLYPSPEQEIFLLRSLGCARKVFNLALADYEKKKALNPKYKWEGAYYYHKQLTLWKKSPSLSYLSEVSCIILQQSILNLDRAFSNMFKGNAKHPRFKSKKSRVEGLKLTRGSFKFKGGDLYIAKVKNPLRVVYSRSLPKNLVPTSISITRRASGKWFVSFSYTDSGSTMNLPKTQKALGIDLGLENYLTTSDGNKVANPRFSRKFREKPAREQRKLSCKKKRQ